MMMMVVIIIIIMMATGVTYVLQLRAYFSSFG
jgi:hypothetical protein